MWLAFKLAKMAKVGILHADIEEMHYLIKKRHAKVREEMIWGVEFPGHRKLKAPIERHTAMVCENAMYGCLHSQNCTGKNLQKHWRRKAKGALPPVTAPPPPGMPPAPPGDSEGVQSSEIKGVPPGYVYIPTPLPQGQIFNLDAYANNRKHDKDLFPELLTDNGTATG